MTLQEFAKKLEDLYATGKRAEPSTFKASCLLPWSLRNDAKNIAPLLPHMKVVVIESMDGVTVEVWGR